MNEARQEAMDEAIYQYIGDNLDNIVNDNLDQIIELLEKDFSCKVLSDKQYNDLYDLVVNIEDYYNDHQTDITKQLDDLETDLVDSVYDIKQILD